jgi:TolB-like protein
MQYKGVRKPPREIARELGVGGIVEGRVLRCGDRVRISTHDRMVLALTCSHAVR